MEEAVDHCANCGTPLSGPYCHSCGQPARSSIRSVFSLIHDFAHDFINWDSRAWRTLLPLMFRPGHLSNEYVAGHRAAYVPPVRLYLLISIAFFVALAVTAQLEPFEFQQTGVTAMAPAEEGEEARPPRRLSEGMNLNLPFMDAAGEAEFKRRVDRLQENPDLFFRQVRTLAPQMMFLLLPLFALVLKVLYLFAKRYYVEHLILALHTHSFLFLAFLALLGLNHAQSTLGGAASWLTTALAIWIPVYLFLAQKRFYGQGWFFTSVKYLLTGTVYFTIMVVAMVGLLIASILTA